MAKVTLNTPSSNPERRTTFTPEQPKRLMWPYIVAGVVVGGWAMTMVSLLVLRPYLAPEQVTIVQAPVQQAEVALGPQLPVQPEPAAQDSTDEITRSAVGLLQPQPTLPEFADAAFGAQPLPAAFNAPVGAIEQHAKEVDEMKDSIAELPICVEQLGELMTTTRISFASGSRTPNQLDMQSAREIALLLEDCHLVMVAVEGHSDTTGQEQTNMALSWTRAEAVIAQLRNEGLDVSAFEPLGFGSRKPLDASGTPAADDVNRRVQFHLAPRPGSGNEMFTKN